MSQAENKKGAGCGLCMDWEKQDSHDSNCIPNDFQYSLNQAASVLNLSEAGTKR